MNGRSTVFARSRGRAFAWVIVALLAHLPIGLAEQGLVVRVDGVGAVRGDVGAARDEAIRDALRSAVEQALGVSVQGRTVMVDLQVVEDRVVGRSEGFVRSYTVVRESRDGDLYRVSIEAVVDTEVMIDDLEGFGALLRTTLGNPRVLVLAGPGDGERGVTAVRQALVDHLVERQFLVLSAEQLGAIYDPTGDLSVAALANLARTVEADLVVSVTLRSDAISSRRTAASEVYSMRVDLSVQAIMAQTAQIVASSSGSATRARASAGAALDDAALDALRDVLTPFTLSTISVLNTTLGGAGTLRSTQVVVDEIFDFAAVLALRDVLTGVRGVSTLQQRQFGDGRATFDLQGSATTDDIALRLMDQDVVPVMVTYLDAQRVVVEVVP